MFEIVCELANTSGKTLTIESSIPEAVKPDVQILKSGQQLGVFASQTRSTVKITVVSVEADARIEKLEAALNKIRETSNASTLFTHKRNIEVIWEIVNETLEK
jgi:hypothetical protein